MKTILIGRTEPIENAILGSEEADGLRVYTISLSYNETYVEVPEEILEKIAKHYGKHKNELNEEEIEEYLLEKIGIEEKIKDSIHYFGKEW